MPINIFGGHVHSEPEPPYYDIVDNLIQQVSNLQNRIESIESVSDTSLCSYPSNLPEPVKLARTMNSKFASTKRFYSHDDLYRPTSTQTTPQKFNDKLQLSSLPNSPNVVRFHVKKNNVKFNTPQKQSFNEQTEIPPVQDVNTFFTNAKTIPKNHAVRNLQNSFNDMNDNHKLKEFNYRNEFSTRPSQCDRDVQQTIQALNKQSEKLTTNKKENFECLDKVNTWQCGEDVNSVPDYNFGIRERLHKPKEITANFQSNKIPPNFQQSSTTTDFTSTNTSLDKSSDSSSDSTQLTAYSRANKYNLLTRHNQDQILKNTAGNVPDATEHERNELLHSPLHDNALSVLNKHKQLSQSQNLMKEERLYKQRGINTLTDNLGLMNLADIWSSSYISQSPSKLTQKVKEEKLRRQHCEQLIKELQIRNLELQEKIAVALKVDESKNQTLEQFREAVDSVSFKLKKLNEEKALWDHELSRLKNQYTVELESAQQKVTYYEKEASRCLNAAQENKDKLASLEKRCSELEVELQQLETRFQEVQDNYDKEVCKNKTLAEILSQKEIELKENKSVLNNAREEISHSRKAVEICQTEFTALKNECALLQTELKNEKSIIASLNEEKIKFTKEIHSYKQKEKTLRDALEQSKVKLENTKMELRNFYQGQLEIIVENKRKEMQTQLDQERQNGLDEIKRKELSMAKTAANHIKEISEKCALETRLLEQKHQEETRLYQMQLSQKEKEIENLQSKLAALPEKRVEIAKQLQKVMENQWNEALKMIGDSSPSMNSEQNLLNSNRFISKPLRSTEDMVDFRHETKREIQFENVSDFEETPISSRGHNKQSESEVQKYINMLLNRQPGNPVLQQPQPPKNQQNQPKPSWNSGVRPRKPK
ncbi:hypothetical protein ABEB36_005535 [Hypothenemus hampei]|uniref:Centrobin n=1 Tax=Hypothenemus hampei TaxID=57062 RepID=A0ABD1EYK4_HYPHA